MIDNNENARQRRIISRVAIIAIAIAVVGVVTYSQISAARKKADAIRQDEERLRMARFQDVVRDIEQIGDKGDEPTRATCRHALDLLAKLEPDWFQTIHFVGYPDWIIPPMK